MKKLTLIFLVFLIAHYNTQAQCTSFETISSGTTHTVALKSDGTLWAWGYNVFGQVGDGTIGVRPTLTQIGIESNWSAISGGGNHTVALKLDGTLWAWGFNMYGQVGDGSTVNRSTPVQIGNDNNWSAISAGSAYTVALKLDGTLWAWGYNYSGQLGDGSTIDRSSPVQIGSDNSWSVISAGESHTIALKKDGTLWAWGYNYYGQLGDGTNSTHNSPVQIGGHSNWTAITSGSGFNLAIKSDSTLWAWGRNDYGQLGDGSTVNRSTPVQIGNDNTWSTVSTGTGHSLALKSNGTLWTWGNGVAGQLGDGSTAIRSTPVQIVSANRWASISGGVAHSVGLKLDKTLWTWGDNMFGQLGDGSTTNRHTPILIHSAYNNSLAVNGSSQALSNSMSHLFFHNNCQLIASAQLGTGAALVTAKVWVSPSDQPAGYLKRHYEIKSSGASTNGRITLYFTNQDFKDFNTQNPVPVLLLPDADDIVTLSRKANLLIEKRGGESTDGSGLPGTYPGAVQNIDPNDDDIIWNPSASRWEVSFEVTSLSGFFVKTTLAALPVVFDDLEAYIKNGQLIVNWSTATETNNNIFEIELSADGKRFNKIGTLDSKGTANNSFTTLNYSFSQSWSTTISVMNTGFAFIFCGLLLFSAKNKRVRFLSLFAGLSIFAVIACNKSESSIGEIMPTKAFVRIAQIDTNGTKTYSKTVQVINKQ